MLQLKASISRHDFTTFDSLEVDVELCNSTEQILEVPGPYDSTDALCFQFYRPGQHTPEKQTNGLQRQMLLSSGRPDPNVSLTTLAPAEKWQRQFDLAPYLSGLSSGNYELQITYSYAPKDIKIASQRIPFCVHERSVEACSFAWANPVISSLCMLVASHGQAQKEYFLRLYGFVHPLAPWYTRKINLQPLPEHAFCAIPTYFATDSFVHFVKTWVVWVADRRVYAQAFVWGKAEGLVRQTLIPEHHELINTGFFTQDDQLFLAFLHDRTDLVVSALHPTELVPIFTRRLPSQATIQPAVWMEKNNFHIASAGKEIIYEQIDLQGQILKQISICSSRFPVYEMVFDPVRHTLKVSFWEKPSGKMIKLAMFDMRTKTFTELTRMVPLRGALRHLSFDCDRKNRFHCLITTSRGRLYYMAHEHGSPQLLARSSEDFWPMLIVERNVFAGWFEPTQGYRFQQIRTLK